MAASYAARASAYLSSRRSISSRMNSSVHSMCSLSYDGERLVLGAVQFLFFAGVKPVGDLHDQAFLKIGFLDAQFFDELHHQNARHHEVVFRAFLGAIDALALAHEVF